MEQLKTRLAFIHREEVDEIIENARKQANNTITTAQAKAAAIKKKETEKILEDTRIAESQQLEIERMNGKRGLADTRYKLVDEAIRQASDRLSKLAEACDAPYRNSLEKLILEAAEQTSGQELEIIIHSRDVTFIKKRLKALEKQIASFKHVPITLRISEEPLRAIGGVVLRTTDGKQIFNNTLEARIAKARQDSIIKISKILYEGSEA